MTKELGHTQPCLYCGQPTQSTEFIINPGAHKELPCCSEECYKKTQDFVGWDNKTRPLFYIILFVLAAVNLMFIGFTAEGFIQYIPLLGIGLLIAAIPSVFAHYERYQKLGIRKTQKIIRIVGGVLAAFAILQMIVS